MKRRILTIALLLISLILHAQGKKRLVFTPQWHAQAQFAGYIIADKMGFYADEGLIVEIKYPTETLSGLSLLQEGRADIITSSLSDAIILKANENLNLVNLMQTSQHAALCLVKKPGTKVVRPSDFSNLRVGLWYSGQTYSAEVMNILQKLNWKIVHFREGFNLMNYDMIDAICAMDYNELLRMKYSGWDVSDYSVLHLSQHGYDLPEDGLYCFGEFYEANKESVDAFVRASKRGWEWCREHPKETIGYIIREMRDHFIYSSEVIQFASLKVILERQEVTPGNVSYQLTEEQLKKTVSILKSSHFISSDIDSQTFIAK